MLRIALLVYCCTCAKNQLGGLQFRSGLMAVDLAFPCLPACLPACLATSCRWLAVGKQLLQKTFYSDQVLSALALSPGGLKPLVIHCAVV
jgi:hypothetical protein